MALVNATDVVNHYVENKPFEISDETKYLEFLTFITNMTLYELSENCPAIEEKEFVAPSSPSNDEYVLTNIYETIDEKYMNTIMLDLKSNLPQNVNRVLGQYAGQTYELRAINEALRSGSLIAFLSVRESLHIIEEWFHLQSEKIVFSNNQIKLLPEETYYILYKRYKTINEVPNNEILTFRRLFEVNLLLGAYESELFSKESGIRSVSVSGLSVSFQVPSSESKVESLHEKKREILSNIALDYSEDMIGTI